MTEVTTNELPKGTGYARLRSWYLARLRRQGILGDMQVELTPMALVRADQQILEKLVMSEVSPQSQQTAGATEHFPITIVLVGIWCLLSLALIAAVALKLDQGLQLLAGLVLLGWPVYWYIIARILRLPLQWKTQPADAEHKH
jgi:hypothetical protein